MAGKEGGVQAILRKNILVLYISCSSHKLNLVVNDANAVPEIRNTVATVKDVITFFRESTTRRNYAPNLSRLCETRWSEKYKSIRKFSQHFSELVKSLETLSDIEVVDLFKEANIFYPAVRKALIILSTIPCTTATVERSFSTLRRVKTWLRSTMGEERLTGLCLMSVHRNYLKDNNVHEHPIAKFIDFPKDEESTVSLSQVWLRAKERIRSKAEKRALKHDKSVKPVVLSAGDKVLVRTHYQSSAIDKMTRKFFLLYEGPYEVIRQVGPNCYELRDALGRISPKQNIINLKPYKELPPQLEM
nr:unnamed protein product [Callosobruchus analis]